VNEGLINTIRKYASAPSRLAHKIDDVSSLQVKPITNVVNKIEKAGNLGGRIKSFKQHSKR